MGSLKEYVAKRRFAKTPEPRGRVGARRSRLFVIQKHGATALHYDFRLEDGGVLRSWAVPKGPSLRSADKRLAMQVEDHPLEYATFEGVIPAGEYGGGTVMVWDIGTWEPEEGSFEKGAIKFGLRGKKVKGSWRLVRTRGRQWLLIKSRDAAAKDEDITLARPRSVVSRRLMAGIAKANGGDVAKAATADPVPRRGLRPLHPPS
jgi:bifunctional non-homologous end joining protein LigD